MVDHDSLESVVRFTSCILEGATAAELAARGRTVEIALRLLLHFDRLVADN